MTDAPSAGWYSDPAHEGFWRWWDGAAWSTQVQPKAQPEPAYAAPEPVYSAPAPVYAQPEPVYEPVFEPAPQPVAISQPISVQPDVVAAPATSSTELVRRPVVAPPVIAPSDEVARAEAFAASEPEPEYPWSRALEAMEFTTLGTAPAVAPTVMPSNPILALAQPVLDPLALSASAPLTYEQLAAMPLDDTRTARSVGSTAAATSPEKVTGSANTVASWLLALWPLLTVGLVGFGVPELTTMLAITAPPTIALYGGSIVVAWIFAGFDIRSLGRRGFATPSILWMLLLPPIGYLLMRARKVSSAGGKPWPPVIAALVSVVVVLLITVSSAAALMALIGTLPV